MVMLSSARLATVLLLPVAVFAAAPVAGTYAFAQPAGGTDPAGGAIITLPGQSIAPPQAAVPAAGQLDPAQQVPPAEAFQPASAPPEDAPAEVAPDGTAGAGDWAAGPDETSAGAEPEVMWELDRPLPGYDAPATPARRRPQLSDAGSPSPLEGASNQAAANQALLAREPRLQREIEPAKRAELTGLARTLGALHALRVSCGGRDDQTWRSRMATLLDLEAPASGTLRDPLVIAFNGGFQASGRGVATCPADPRAAEARLARQGRQFALALAARYRPPPAPAAAGPQGAQPEAPQPAAARQVTR
jgi:uncharacterized protein (TIGR02301 family)